MKNLLNKTLVIALVSLSLAACKKDKEEDNAVGYGEVQVEFDHRANGQAFAL